MNFSPTDNCCSHFLIAPREFQRMIVIYINKKHKKNHKKNNEIFIQPKKKQIKFK